MKAPEATASTAGAVFAKSEGIVGIRIQAKPGAKHSAVTSKFELLRSWELFRGRLPPFSLIRCEQYDPGNQRLLNRCQEVSVGDLTPSPIHLLLVRRETLP